MEPEADLLSWSETVFIPFLTVAVKKKYLLQLVTLYVLNVLRRLSRIMMDDILNFTIPAGAEAGADHAKKGLGSATLPDSQL